MKILFFASVAELTGCTDTTINGVHTTEELKIILNRKFPGLDRLSYVVAVNKSLVTGKMNLVESDEVALLPPFSGG